MQQLTNAEEQLMEHLWKLEKAFMKDLLDISRPNQNDNGHFTETMIDKDFVAYTEFGNSREYYPLVKKTAYFSKHVNGLIKNFFNNFQFASFFTETNLSERIRRTQKNSG
jgi:predicted transcriptional regulator